MTARAWCLVMHEAAPKRRHLGVKQVVLLQRLLFILHPDLATSKSHVSARGKPQHVKGIF